MKYKMLVLDMDDTLLNDDHQISEKNKEMILKAQEKRGRILKGEVFNYLRHLNAKYWLCNLLKS